MEARLIELETKVSYQEKLLEDLDGVVREQQEQLERLELRVAQLVTQWAGGSGPAQREGESESEGEEPPPPHY